MNTSVRHLVSRIRECAKLVHRSVKVIEPWGIFLAVIALFVTLIELSTDRKVREATMIGLASDRLEATRQLERNKRGTARYNTGQVRMLETMARLGIGLNHMDLSDMTNVDFVCSDLRGANLIGALLTDADLTWAKLTRAKIADANFADADLYGADLSRIKVASGVDFSKAKFRNTRLRNMDLRTAKGLTDRQIRDACGYDVEFPSYITEKLKRCSEEQEREQKCAINRETEAERILDKLIDIRKDVSKIRKELRKAVQKD